MRGGLVQMLMHAGLAFIITVTGISSFADYRENLDEATRPPQIVREPDFTEIPLGEDGALYLHAIGAETLDYQWYHNHEAIEGARTNVLEISDATREDAGLYHVSVTSEFGYTTSKIVRLRVDEWENIRAIDRTVTGDQSGKSTLAFYKGFFVAGGENGALSRSTDGYSWENLDPIPGNFTIEKLVPGQSRLLALLDQAGVVAWTGDFNDWNFSIIDEAIETVETIVHSQGIFAALVNTNTGTRLFTSSDGSDWEVQHDFVVTEGSSSLSATNYFFVAAKSNDNGTEFVSSLDGLEWVTRFDSSLVRVSKNYAFNEVVIIEDTDHVFTSENGSDWTILEDRIYITPFSKTLQVGGSYYGIFNNNIFESLDFKHWDRVFTYFETPFGEEPIVKPFIGTFEYGNGRFVYGPVEGSFYPIFDFDNFEIVETPNVFPSNLSLNGIGYLNNEFIIRTDDRAILVSDTGGDWELKEVDFNIATFDRVEELAYGNGIYANGNIFGPDLDHFELIRSRIKSSFDQVAFGNGVFVGINEEGAYHSQDGKIWTFGSPIVPRAELMFQDGRFVAVGAEASIATSEDGINWSLAIIDDGSENASHDFTSIAYGNGQFVAVARSGAGTAVYRSSDGLFWEQLVLDFSAIAEVEGVLLEHIDIAFGAGRFVLMFENWILDTADFQTWEFYPFDTQTLFEIQYGGGSFIAIGATGRIVQIGKPDGIPPSVAFQYRNTVSLLPSEKVELLADAYDVDGKVEKVEFSVDGEIVRTVTHPPYDWEWYADKTGVYELKAVAIDDSGMMALDALTVNVSRPGFVSHGVPGSGIHDIAYDGEIYLAVSDEYTMTSTDVRNWEPQAKPDGMLTSLAFGNDVFTAMGLSNTVFISSDGLSWVQKEVDPLFEGEADSIRFLNISSEFILEKRGIPVAASLDGVNWMEPHEGLTGNGSIREVGDHLFALFEDGRLYRSANGIDWLPTHETLNVGYPHFENNVYLTRHAELQGMLLRSVDGINWEVVESPLASVPEYVSFYLQPIDAGFLIKTKNDARFGDYFSKDGIVWEEALISLPGTFQRKIIQVNGERFSVIDPIEFPLGPISPPDSALMRLSSDDLSISIVRISQEFVGDTNHAAIGVTVSNRGGKSIVTNGLSIDARIADEDHSTENPTNVFDRQSLPVVDLLPGESYSIPLEFEIPVAIDLVGRTFHLELNGDKRIPEINLSNNTAWLRLLPAPEISIEESDSNSIEINWSREGGYVKRVEYSYDLENWFLLDAPAESMESKSYKEPANTERETFYRVRAE